ncbi:MAG: MotA/TolQ/ExbB proton channel family protein [Spirochaetaceae bacterium]
MEQTLLELFKLGGWAMWPLVLFSVATLSLVVERLITLGRRDLEVKRLAAATVEALGSGGVAQAKDACLKAPESSAAAPVFLDALDASSLGEHRCERAMEAAAAEQVYRLERGFDLLLALGSIAPITGFLGTVSGMIGAFNTLARAEAVSAQLIAGGIFEALITTAYGLAIALVAITGYNILSHRVDRFAADLEGEGNRLLIALARSQVDRREG